MTSEPRLEIPDQTTTLSPSLLHRYAVTVIMSPLSWCRDVPVPYLLAADVQLASCLVRGVTGTRFAAAGYQHERGKQYPLCHYRVHGALLWGAR